MFTKILAFVIVFISFPVVRADGISASSGELQVNVSEMVQIIEDRMNQSIDALRRENKELKERVLYLESRQDLQKTAVIFSVRYREGQVSDVHDHDTLRFDDILTNVGNGFHTENGSFRAPVSGYYMFFISVYPLSNRVQVCLRVKDTDVFCAAGNNISEQGANMAFLHLRKGEFAKVTKLWGNTNRLYGTHWTTFSGFLVSQDGVIDGASGSVGLPVIG